MTRAPKPLVQRLPHNPKAHVIENKAIYAWANRKFAA